MGMDLISAGWTTTTAHTTDIESVNRWIDDLSDFAILTRIDQLDEAGIHEHEWPVHLAEPDEHGAEFPIDEHHEDDGAYEENKETAQAVRDTLKFGAQTVFEEYARMSNTWSIPGTTLQFTIMGGGSWGDDPFDGYSAACMFVDCLAIWPDLKELTNIVTGGLPRPEIINQHISDETTKEKN